MLFSCPAGAVAAAGKRSGSSSSRSRTKQLKSSFSIDFRSYVRQFLVPIFMLLRPSVPCCFPVRQVRSQQQEKEAGAAAAVAGQSSSNSSFSIDFWRRGLSFASFRGSGTISSWSRRALPFPPSSGSSRSCRSLELGSGSSGWSRRMPLC